MSVERTCKHCGCNEKDACYHPEFGNCWWINEDECSHCIEVPGEAIRWSMLPPDTTADQLDAAVHKVLKSRKTPVVIDRGQTNEELLSEIRMKVKEIHKGK